LENSLKIEKIIESQIDFSVPYLKMNEVMQFLKQYEIELITNDYSDESIHFKVSVRNKLLESLKEKIEHWQ
jgi:putative IMPACT (imprinted ancient) family translation regulator